MFNHPTIHLRRFKSLLRGNQTWIWDSKFDNVQVIISQWGKHCCVFTSLRSLSRLESFEWWAIQSLIFLSLQLTFYVNFRQFQFRFSVNSIESLRAWKVSMRSTCSDNLCELQVRGWSLTGLNYLNVTLWPSRPTSLLSVMPLLVIKTIYMGRGDMFALIT